MYPLTSAAGYSITAQPDDVPDPGPGPDPQAQPLMRPFVRIVLMAACPMLAGSGRLQAQAPAAVDPAPHAESERPLRNDVALLEQLDWMVGDWVLVPDDEAATKQLGAMTMSVRWDHGHRFLIREATLTPPAESGEPEVVLHQRIGWDPLVGRIRSWSFSTDGSRAEATWFPDRGSWIVRGTAVLPDGTQASSLNIYTFDGKDRFTWRIVRPPLDAADDPPARATWVRTPRSTNP